MYSKKLKLLDHEYWKFSIFFGNQSRGSICERELGQSDALSLGRNMPKSSNLYYFPNVSQQ